MQLQCIERRKDKAMKIEVPNVRVEELVMQLLAEANRIAAARAASKGEAAELREADCN